MQAIKKKYDLRLMLTGCLDVHDFMVVHGNAVQSLHKLEQEKEGSDRHEWIQFHMSIVEQAIDTLPEWAERRLTVEALTERQMHNRSLMEDEKQPERVRRAAEQRYGSITKELEAIAHGQ
ncbi:hypothetical protein GZH47_33410 (plasmid) [Paenibacillus rhizovicinus]|uniref:Uncharacterized protein n=1 Tax=Paenibacillus rhizovicinus TaxID=2704463 RepID=A0A6C0PCL0_9BACL|nr:hypothetical protein [Paenibacillus rhizovicinus]QHW35793.1 hypothetical protein GZH47_33410 [Paenibacillus rhizovicinus]